VQALGLSVPEPPDTPPLVSDSVLVEEALERWVQLVSPVALTPSDPDRTQSGMVLNLSAAAGLAGGCTSSLGLASHWLCWRRSGLSLRCCSKLRLGRIHTSVLLT
jgi:hypothetical protein